MTPIKNINIPSPCSQQWQDMKPVNEGRHCMSCRKTVTDFTAMSNSEIINYLAANTHVCGRFQQQQLNTLNNQFYTEDLRGKGKLKAVAMAIGLLGSLPFFKAGAQTKQAVTQIIQDISPVQIVLGKIKVASPAPATYREIKGHVFDNENQAIPGALITAIPGNNGCQANVNGNFHLFVPSSVKQFTVKYVGYNMQTVNIDTSQSGPYEIKLKESAMMLGEVVIVKKPSFTRRMYYKYIRRPLKKLFH